MLTEGQVHDARARAAERLAAAGIALTPSEIAQIEVADFGLGRLAEIGLEVVVYVNTERVCAKELVLFPHQACPEHRHPPFEGSPGKEETFRVRTGLAEVYIGGATTAITLGPGEQLTVPPDTLHWFQAGPDGAIVSEFSTHSRDDLDIFSDPAISRATVIGP
jgi:D-lyxose ketol-isomerase